MASVSFGSGHIGRLAALGVVIAVAGCQSDGSTGFLNLGGGQTKQPTVTAAELRAFCPRVTLREGTAYYNTFTRDGQDDPTKIVYQASLGEVTRACTYGPGTINVTVAAAGRVVPGPAAQAGSITMPIRIAAMRGDEVLYSQLHQHQVAIGAGPGATQFVFTDPAVTFPTPGDRNVQIYVGFDEGPPKPRRRGEQ